MRVITIGRTPDNDVVIHDPKISRHHAQIVQHERGEYSIVDLKSTNGTYVNGTRIYGECVLKIADKVSLGKIEIPWQSYFHIGSDNKRKSLFTIIGSSCAAMLTIVIVVATIISYNSQTADIYFNGEYPQVEEVYYTENGKEYYFNAFRGQVIVFFDEHTPYNEAKKIIEINGGTILSQIIDMHYFLIEVNAGAENTFIQNIASESSVDYAFLHIPKHPCTMSAHILDNTLYPDKYGNIHGQTVAAVAMAACDECVFAYEYNIALDEYTLSTDKATEYFKTILSKDSDSPILINNSYGVYLMDTDSTTISYNELLKDKKQDPKKMLDRWVRGYISDMKELIHSVKPYKDKDFIVTKSSGNNGCPEFDKVILNALYNSLTDEEREIMDNHIIFVSAYDETIVTIGKDDKLHNISSNSIRNPKWWNTYGVYADRPQTYHNWVTTTDISHLSYKDGKSIDGTSFAAPNALGNIARIIDRYNITAKEALQAVKKVTKENAQKNGGAGILDVVALDKEAKIIAEERRKLSPQATYTPTSKSKSNQPENSNPNGSTTLNPSIPGGQKEALQFTGVWIDNEQTTKLDLKQNGTRLTGYYHTTDHGCELDDPYCMQSIAGTISGNTANFTYYSPHEGGKNIAVTLKLLSETKMEWVNSKKYNAYLSGSIYFYKQRNTKTTIQNPKTIGQMQLKIENTRWRRYDDGNVTGYVGGNAIGDILEIIEFLPNNQLRVTRVLSPYSNFKDSKEYHGSYEYINGELWLEYMYDPKYFKQFKRQIKSKVEIKNGILNLIDPSDGLIREYSQF